MSYRHNFLVLFFLGGCRGTWPFTLREHWKITHYFREQHQCEGMFENNFKEQGRS